MNPLDVPVEIAREEVLRLLAYPEGRQPEPNVGRLLEEALREARTLVRPRGIFALLPVERAPEVGLAPLSAEELAIGLVTIGGALEQQVGEASRGGDVMRAVLLDAAGSAAAEEAANWLSHHILRSGAHDPGGAAPEVPCRLSPGYPGWPLGAQTALFALLGWGEVELLPSLMMRPRKSVSFALWKAPRARPAAGLSSCDCCALERCRHRRAPRAGRA